MTRFFSLRAKASAAVLAAAVAFTLASPEGRQLPLEALKDSGQQIYPAFEGWYQNADGSYNLLLGYYTHGRSVRSAAEPICREVPGCPPEFAFELQRLWNLRQTTGNGSLIVALQFLSLIHI